MTIHESSTFIEYNGVKWSTALLCDGATKTQKEWVLYLESTPWRLPTFKEYRSLLGCPDKEFMKSLKPDLLVWWLMTSDFLKNPFSGEDRPVVLGLYVNDYGFRISACYDEYNRPARGVKK